MLKSIYRWIVRKSLILYFPALIERRLDAEEVTVRRLMGACFARATLKSCSKSAGEAGLWIRYVVCGETAEAGSLLSLISQRHTPPEIPTASMIFYGDEEFRRGAAMLVKDRLPSESARDITELRAAIAAPLTDDDSSVPRGFVVAQDLSNEKPRGLGCRAVTAYLEMLALNVTTPVLVLYDSADDDYAQEIISHAGLRSVTVDCGRLRGHIVSADSQ